jgi:hypothetical protein
LGNGRGEREVGQINRDEVDRLRNVSQVQRTQVRRF